MSSHSEIPAFKSDRELFDYVRSFDASSLKPLSTILENYNFVHTEIDFLLRKLFDENTLIVDARSEKEYEETHIPRAQNFPVLNNIERHFVGLVYKKYSGLAAVKLALQYSSYKTKLLNEFLKRNDAQDKEIFVYCWRGGGRSKYLSKMIIDAGYKPKTLVNGIKSYRHKVNALFGEYKFPYGILEINGLTGSGKSELIQALRGKLPAIDFENAARHYSSLFGYVPYKIRGYEAVKTQTAFENNIFEEVCFNRFKFPTLNTFIAESESRKVGDFYIPLGLYKALEETPAVKLETVFADRVQRLKRDYFEHESGFREMLSIFTAKERLFRKEMSSKFYDASLKALEKKDADEFIQIMLEKYYDVKYKDKGKKPLAVIRYEDTEEAAKEVMKVYSDIEGLAKL